MFEEAIALSAFDRLVGATSMRTKATKVQGIKPCCYKKKNNNYNNKNRAQNPAAMDSFFGQVRPHQHGTASRSLCC